MNALHLGRRRPAWPRLAGCAVALGLIAAPARPAFAAKPETARPIRIVLVGDSTVTDAAGWGLGFKCFLTDGAECLNASRGGRSSRSYLNEGLWQKALELKGDYYLIQFGHNDEPGKGPARETDPATTFPQFMARYVDETQAIGARPILVTPLTRRKFDPADRRKLLPSLVPYAAAVRALAAEKHVPLIDLHARSIALCEELGEEGCAGLSARTKDGKVDTTHLNPQGSLAFARLVVAELRRVVPNLAPVLRAEPAPLPVAVAAPAGSSPAADSNP